MMVYLQSPQKGLSGQVWAMGGPHTRVHLARTLARGFLHIACAITAPLALIRRALYVLYKLCLLVSFRAPVIPNPQPWTQTTMASFFDSERNMPLKSSCPCSAC